MAEDNAITVKIGAETDGIERGLAQIQSSLKKIEGAGNESASSFDSSFLKMSGAVAVGQAAVKVFGAVIDGVFSAARGVVDGFGQAIDLGGRLTDLSSRTGESAGNLLVLERAFTNTGVSADSVGTSLNKMQKFMTDAAQGGVAQSDAMQRLGLVMSDLAGKTPTEQMAVFAQRISGIQDPAQRAEAAMSIFGKSGGELLPILNNFKGELEGARDQLGALPGVMDRSSSAFDGVGDSMAAINSKIMEFAAGFLESALPALTTFTNALSGIDAAGWGQAAMDTIRSIADTLVGAFKDPLGAIEAWGLAYEAGYKSLANGLLNAGVTFVGFLQEAFQTNLPSAIGTFITSKFIDSALTLSRYLTEALMTFSSGLSTIPGLEAVGEKMLTTLGAVNDSIIAEQLANMGQSKEAAARVVEEFGKAAEKTKVFKEDFFGAEDATKRMKEKFGELEANGKKTRENFETTATNSAAASANIYNTATNSAAVASNFGTAAEKSNDVATAILNAKKINDEIVAGWDKIAGKAYTATQSTLAQQAAINEAVRTMTDADFSKGFSTLKDTLRDFGGEYEKLANSGAGIKTIAESLGLDSEEKNPKRLLVEIQEEIKKIGNTPAEIDIKFSAETFAAGIQALRDKANQTFADPVAFSVKGDESIGAVRETVEQNFVDPLSLKFTGEQSIEDVKSSVDSNFASPVPLTFSGSDSANQVLQSVQDAFSQPNTLTFGADTTAAANSVATLGDTRLTLAPGADTTAAQNAISQLGATPVALAPTTDTTAAAAAFASLGATPISLSPTADTAQAQANIGNLGDFKIPAFPIAADTAEAKTQIESLGKLPQTISLDASKSLEDIKGKLRENIDLAVTTGEGSKILGEIKGFVEELKRCVVEKLEPKLPTHALA